MHPWSCRNETAATLCGVRRRYARARRFEEGINGIQRTVIAREIFGAMAPRPCGAEAASSRQ